MSHEERPWPPTPTNRQQLRFNRSDEILIASAFPGSNLDNGLSREREDRQFSCGLAPITWRCVEGFAMSVSTRNRVEPKKSGANQRHSVGSPWWQVLGAAINLLVLLIAFLIGARGIARVFREAPSPALAIPSAPVLPCETAETRLPSSEPAVTLTEEEQFDALPQPTELETLSLPPLAFDRDAMPELLPPPREQVRAALPAVKFNPVRRNKLSEIELFKQLVDFPDFNLNLAARQGMVQAYAREYQTKSEMRMHGEFEPSILLRHFPAASQLPIRSGPSCQLSRNEAANLGVLAKKLHAYLDLIAPMDMNGKRNPARLRNVLRQERRGKTPEWLRPEAVPAMVQILMAEDVPVRLILVDMLADIPGRVAGERLAQRAVFDLSSEVRQAAIYALRDRPPAEGRQVLVNAIRYPWPAVADHAAEALVALEDRDAAPLLVAQLSKPDPAAPFAAGNDGAAVREVVAINHAANCLLCHAPAVGGRDLVIGVDPLAQRPPPDVERRYGRPSNGQGIWAGKVLIRADVQFLRQDFSVTFPIHRLFAEVAGQRLDYVVRTRLLKGAELRDWKKQTPPEPTAYRQREAILFALRALTGQDVGPTTDAWVKLFPWADAEAEGVRMSTSLMKASVENRDHLLARYRDAKEDAYTEGLARAIPHLKGKLQGKVREALVQRLTRQSPDGLRPYLVDENADLGHAAALACIRKQDKELTPELIGLL